MSNHGLGNRFGFVYGSGLGLILRNGLGVEVPYGLLKRFGLESRGLLSGQRLAVSLFGLVGVPRVVYFHLYLVGVLRKGYFLGQLDGYGFGHGLEQRNLLLAVYGVVVYFNGFRTDKGNILGRHVGHVDYNVVIVFLDPSLLRLGGAGEHGRVLELLRKLCSLDRKKPSHKADCESEQRGYRYDYEE